MVVILLGIAMLILTGNGVSALNSTSWAYCRVYPDPHFTTWHGDFYDYHGGCDLVLITNSVLDFHIRTKNFSGWSGIEAAAIRIGSDKLEVQEPSGSIIFNNINSTASPPTSVGGYPFLVMAGPPVKFRLNMAGGQYIELTRTYGNTLQVDVKGHGSDFGSSQGLCANWTANSPNALVDRDKVTVYALMPIQNAYGEEWQVNAPVGDPLLFQTNSSGKCLYSQGGRCREGTTDCQKEINEAKTACANIPVARNARVNCEFDVLTTGDVGFAKSIAYIDPLIGDPPEFCTEITNATVNNGCKDKGGRCVWRCDKNTHICVDTLCQGPTDGCSCALPLSRTHAPTAKPMMTPVTAPAKPNDTRAPTAKPNTSPVSSPVKPNDTRNPTAKPNTTPVTSPVKPIDTRVPTTKPNTTPVKPSGSRAPTRKPAATVPVPTPIKPVVTVPVPIIKETKPPTRVPTKDTRKPTQAPTRKRCGLLGWSVICFRGCGLLRRFLGLC